MQYTDRAVIDKTIMCRASSIVIAVAFLIVLLDGRAIGKMRVAYQWKQIDYDWPSNDTKKLFPDYKQENNLPVGLEVAGDRIFVTVPRWKLGVAASLNYIRLNGDYNQLPPIRSSMSARRTRVRLIWIHRVFAASPSKSIQRSVESVSRIKIHERRSISFSILR